MTELEKLLTTFEKKMAEYRAEIFSHEEKLEEGKKSINLELEALKKTIRENEKKIEKIKVNIIEKKIEKSSHDSLSKYDKLKKENYKSINKFMVKMNFVRQDIEKGVKKDLEEDINIDKKREINFLSDELDRYLEDIKNKMKTLIPKYTLLKEKEKEQLMTEIIEYATSAVAQQKKQQIQHLEDFFENLERENTSKKSIIKNKKTISPKKKPKPKLSKEIEQEVKNELKNKKVCTIDSYITKEIKSDGKKGRSLKFENKCIDVVLMWKLEKYLVGANIHYTSNNGNITHESNGHMYVAGFDGHFDIDPNLINLKEIEINKPLFETKATKNPWGKFKYKHSKK